MTVFMVIDLRNGENIGVYQSIWEAKQRCSEYTDIPIDEIDISGASYVMIQRREVE